MSTLCIIPARKGSVRIPRKNWQFLDGQTLLAHAVDAAIESGVIDEVVVSTDASHGDIPEEAVYHYRKEHLCGGAVDISEVVSDVITSVHPNMHDTIVVLQPATPLRSPALIKNMLNNMRDARCNGAITMARCVPWTWEIDEGQARNAWHPHPYPRSQDVRYTNLQEINTVQICTREIAMQGKRWDLPLLITELPTWATLDIDEPHELETARKLWPTLKEEFDTIERFPFHVVHRINGCTPC